LLHVDFPSDKMDKLIYLVISINEISIGIYTGRIEYDYFLFGIGFNFDLLCISQITGTLSGYCSIACWLCLFLSSSETSSLYRAAWTCIKFRVLALCKTNNYIINDLWGLVKLDLVQKSDIHLQKMKLMLSSWFVLVHNFQFLV